MQKSMYQERPLISVIIPIYNVCDYLKMCLNSVCEQTYGNIEVILVDDGSTDGCNAICKEYAKHDKRIILIEKENGGPGSARKAGLKEAKGRYIVFVDADDWVERDYLEQIVLYITGEEAADIVAFGCIEEYASHKIERNNAVQKGRYTGEKLKELHHRMFMTDNFFEWGVLPHLWDKVIKREIVSNSVEQISDIISFGEDAACTAACIFEARSVEVLEVRPYHYRQRESSIVNELRELKKEKIYMLYQNLKNTFGEDTVLQEQLKYYMFFVLFLKKYSSLSNLGALFPFQRVSVGCKILVYGAGGFGKVIEQFVRESSGLQLAGWADQNAAYYQKSGLDVIYPKEIVEKEFDYVVIAILNEYLAKKIKDELMEFGINESKIDFVKKEVLRQTELPRWLENRN